MDKRYQVFVSSTYKDLREERQEVMQALLELDCIPAGMELFPAADEDQWSLIKKVIDDCDYYIVIVGGRYGSQDAEGNSYTQKEYEYAVSIGKPVMGFLHRDPSKIATGKTDASDEDRKKLLEFRKLVETKMCKYWETPAELGSVVSRSLIKLIKTHPASGWVKGDLVLGEDAAKEILKLKGIIEDYEQKMKELREEGPQDISDLAQGEDKFEIGFQFAGSDDNGYSLKSKDLTGKSSFSWNQIFAHIAPLLINEASEADLIHAINGLIYKHETSRLKKLHPGYKFTFYSYIEYFQTIKIQLRALKLITPSSKKHAIHDKQNYWSLTPFGEAQLERLRAIKKK
jgi:hypothetical protein